MKITWHRLQAAALVVLGLSIAFADSPFRMTWRGTGGWGDKSAYCSLFEAKNVETLHGVILSVEQVTPLPGMSPGIQIQLKTSKESIAVHLGPQWFIENQDLELNPGDKVTVKGSRVVCNGERAMSASELREGHTVLKLRNKDGIPLWAGSSHEE